MIVAKCSRNYWRREAAAVKNKEKWLTVMDSNWFRFENMHQVGSDNILMATFKPILRHQFNNSLHWLKKKRGNYVTTIQKGRYYRYIKWQWKKVDRRTLNTWRLLCYVLRPEFKRGGLKPIRVANYHGSAASISVMYRQTRFGYSLQRLHLIFIRFNGHIFSYGVHTRVEWNNTP